MSVRHFKPTYSVPSKTVAPRRRPVILTSKDFPSLAPAPTLAPTSWKTTDQVKTAPVAPIVMKEESRFFEIQSQRRAQLMANIYHQQKVNDHVAWVEANETQLAHLCPIGVDFEDFTLWLRYPVPYVQHLVTETQDRYYVNMYNSLRQQVAYHPILGAHDFSWNYLGSFIDLFPQPKQEHRPEQEEMMAEDY